MMLGRSLGLAALSTGLFALEAPALAAEASWCHAAFDERQQALVLSYSGQAPRFSTLADAQGLQLRFTFEDLTARRFTFADDLTRGSGFVRWGLTRQNGQAALIIRLAPSVGWLLAEDPERREARLTLRARLARPRPPASAPSPEAVGLEAPMLGRAEPLVALATRSAPPQRVALPPAVPSAAFRLGPSFWVADYHEHYPQGDIQLRQEALVIPGFDVSWRAEAPDAPADAPPAWQGRLRLGTVARAFRDQSFPLSAHLRQAWALETSFGPGLGWGPLSFEGGLGYWLRYEQSLHSAVPPQPTYAFAGERWLHGPQLSASLGWSPIPADRWWGGWRLVAAGDLRPLVFSHLDAGISPLPRLLGGQLQLALERPLWGHQLSIGLQRRVLTGFGGYDEVFQGPFLSFQ